MSIYKGTTLISGVGNSVHNIGEIVPSILPLTDAGLHLLDGSLLSGTGVYADFVTYIAGLVSSYPNSFVTEASWQTSVSAYGVCGKFVYDSVNNTVRLPKITGIIEGTVDVTALGDLVEAGLPNIKGEWGIGGTSSIAATSAAGAMSVSDSYSGAPASSNQTGYQKVYFDASRYSTIYKDSFNKVQPQTIKAYYYIVVANSVKTSIQADIDDIATDLNLKAGTDLANLTNQGSIVAAKASMPSTTHDVLSWPATGTNVTAPSDGWFFARRSSDGSNTGITLLNQTTGVIAEAQHAGGTPSVFVPAAKGDTVTLYWLNGASSNSFWFVYAEGSKSEA